MKAKILSPVLLALIIAAGICSCVPGPPPPVGSVPLPPGAPLPPGPGMVVGVPKPPLPLPPLP